MYLKKIHILSTCKQCATPMPLLQLSYNPWDRLLFKRDIISLYMQISQGTIILAKTQANGGVTVRLEFHCECWRLNRFISRNVCTFPLKHDIHMNTGHNVVTWRFSGGPFLHQKSFTVVCEVPDFYIVQGRAGPQAGQLHRSTLCWSQYLNIFMR